MNTPAETEAALYCYHCGDMCHNADIHIDNKIFCCEGCRMVFQILDMRGLCEYYDLNKSPGISQRINVRENKFAFLDKEEIRLKLINFEDEKQVHVTFYCPQMHCSSCLYLLENLHKINRGIVSGKVNFTRKELDLVFSSSQTSLRQVAETLAGIGYEPYISLNDLQEKRLPPDKSLVYRLGVAGFCFGNIMLMSFPEYFGIDASETGLRNIFRWLNFILAIPVFLYAAFPFYRSAWSGLKHRFLNIDAPVALAIIITFFRSAYEVISGTGGGYFDSMTGIVFFMLAGRIVQDKTYKQLSFERDYTSYFPIAVSVLKDEREIQTMLPDIRTGDTLLVHNEELIPADGILSRGKAFIDYSFVTGESLPVRKEIGEIVYAGGKQVGGNIEVLTIKQVSQSYLTRLWNRTSKAKKGEEGERSFVHLLSRYFTYLVFAIALATGIYWQIVDPSTLWPAVTAVFIVACPCALLLSDTFTSGNILRILGRHQFYLKNTQVIQDITRVTHIVFDKTGTLTNTQKLDVDYQGIQLSPRQQKDFASLAACSSHPLSQAIAGHLGRQSRSAITNFKEKPGYGIEGIINGDLFSLGSYEFIMDRASLSGNTNVFASINDKLYGFYSFQNHYRDNMVPLLQQLKKHYRLSVVSGDTDTERWTLRRMLGEDASILFHQKPEDKLRYVEFLQKNGENVMMIGDGLNDAGALDQSNVGVAVTDQANNFTPASDAIIKAGKLPQLMEFIRLCRANRLIIIASFIVSIIYNIIGLSFAVQGVLSPLIAAILMPASSLTILLLTFGSSNLAARKLGSFNSYN